MNPNTREQKKALVEVLNNADLDQNTGESLSHLSSCAFHVVAMLIWITCGT